MANGICKLTGKNGRFVRAHIIPDAFTRPALPGAPLIQAGQGGRPIRRWTGWYDPALVIREGEDILAAYDDWAIAELRRLQLVWSGWGPMQSLPAGENHVVFENKHGVRVIEDTDTRRLRLFLLSLLWRAAETQLPEFGNVVLSPEELTELRRMLIDGDPGAPDFFPVTLTQLSTVGPPHNHTVLDDVMYLDFLAEQPRRGVPIYRFYFDGLIAHVRRDRVDPAANMGPLAVGFADKLVLSTLPYELSLQRENLVAVVAQTEKRWPGTIDRIHRAGDL